jgi:two-component system, OmpR family, KDP operon response regulator KdpE
VTHVLVVDDDPHILRTLRIHLAGHGYTVATAENGRDAIRLACADRSRPNRSAKWSGTSSAPSGPTE